MSIVSVMSTHIKSHRPSIGLKVVTLNDLELPNSRYFVSLIHVVSATKM